MSSNLKIFRFAQAALILLLACALLVRLLVRAPQGASATEVYDRVELTGRAREIVVQTVRLVRAAADPEALADAEIQNSLLAGAKRTSDAAADVSATIRAANSEWVQLKEAVPLMKESRELLQMTIDRVLTPSSTNDDLNVNPALIQSAEEASRYLEERARNLEDRSSQLSARMKQAIAYGVFAQGLLLGFTPPDILLIVLTLSTLISLTVIARTVRQFRTPLAKLEKSEIELLGRSDRRKAIQRCHDRVRQLLELAGALCRGDVTS